MTGKGVHTILHKLAQPFHLTVPPLIVPLVECMHYFLSSRDCSTTPWAILPLSIDLI